MAKFDLTVLLLAKDMASKTIGKVGKEVSTLGRISGSFTPPARTAEKWVAELPGASMGVATTRAESSLTAVPSSTGWW